MLSMFLGKFPGYLVIQMDFVPFCPSFCAQEAKRLRDAKGYQA